MFFVAAGKRSTFQAGTGVKSFRKEVDPKFQAEQSVWLGQYLDQIAPQLGQRTAIVTEFIEEATATTAVIQHLNRLGIEVDVVALESAYPKSELEAKLGASVGGAYIGKDKSIGKFDHAFTASAGVQRVFGSPIAELPHYAEKPHGESDQPLLPKLKAAARDKIKAFSDEFYAKHFKAKPADSE